MFSTIFFIHPNISLFYRVISLFYRELSFILLFPPFEVDCSSFYLISCCFVEDCQKSPKPGICRGSSNDETNEIVNFGTLKLNFKWSQQNAALPASKEDGKWKWMPTKKKCITRKVLNLGLAFWKCEALISAKKLFCSLKQESLVSFPNILWNGFRTIPFLHLFPFSSRTGISKDFQTSISFRDNKNVWRVKYKPETRGKTNYSKIFILDNDQTESF